MTSDSGDPIIVSNTTPIDDLAARREALSRNGTVGMILLAKKLGLIPNVKEILDDLIACGARIGRRLYLDALNVAGE